MESGRRFSRCPQKRSSSAHGCWTVRSRWAVKPPNPTHRAGPGAPTASSPSRVVPASLGQVWGPRFPPQTGERGKKGPGEGQGAGRPGLRGEWSDCPSQLGLGSIRVCLLRNPHVTDEQTEAKRVLFCFLPR